MNTFFKNIWQHLSKNFWLYTSIIIGVVGLWFFNVIAGWVGGYKNATYLLAAVLLLTGGIYLWKLELLKRSFQHMKKNWYWYALGGAVSFFLGYVFEGAILHSYLMVVREYSFVVFFLPIVFLMFKLAAKQADTWKEKVVFVSTAVVVIVAVVAYITMGGQQYIAHYLKYQEVVQNVVVLKKKPETSLERIFPRDVYKSVLDQSLGDNNLFSDPDLVMEEGRVYFTSSVTPLKMASKLWEAKIEKVVRIGADTPSVDSSIKEDEVLFSVGEGLVWSRDIYNYSIKSLGWRYFNTFPTNVQLMKNSKGKTVMVVSLAKWDGIFFPTPEFYGVMVVEQGEISWPRRAILGGATIITRGEIPKYKWLLNQNLNSEVSTKYIAESFAFQNGFLAPMSFVHDDDVVVTDMEGSRNDFPLVTVFNIGGKKKLYDFYELKPWKETSTNARIYLFVPSDGQGKVYMYQPKNVVSMAELAHKVKGSVDYNTEEKYVFAEPRPYFRDDLPELFIVSRVLRRRDGSFDPSGVKTYLINAKGTRNKVVEVPTDEPQKWLDIARKSFSD